VTAGYQGKLTNGRWAREMTENMKKCSYKQLERQMDLTGKTCNSCSSEGTGTDGINMWPRY